VSTVTRELVERSVEVLERTPTVLSALLGGLSDFWSLGNYGEGTFSPFDVVGHLIHADRTNWLPRIRLVLERGKSEPLPAFDRYAMYQASRGKTTDDLLAEFASLRAASLGELRALDLTPQKLALRGTHPQLGAVTVGQLIAAWAVHDLGHLHQVARAMAFQHRDQVGPFRELLTILPRLGPTDTPNPV
jgi:hypothetical protein